MQASDLAATEEALVMFRYKVRRALRDQQGYECQEADGDFMLAFNTPCDAARFCLSVGHNCPVASVKFPFKSAFRAAAFETKICVLVSWPVVLAFNSICNARRFWRNAIF